MTEVETISNIDLPILDKDGKQVDTLQIDPALLGGEIRFSLLKQAYVITHGNQRQGSARTKSRGMVHGSTRKIYKQKGTGNARAGAARTIVRKGGGVAFAKTRTREDFRSKMTKKMRRLANRNALLAKLVDGEVRCITDLRMDSPKTRDMITLLAAIGIDRTCLVALDAGNRNAALSARNVENVDTIRVAQLNAFELLNHRYLVIDRASLESFLDSSCFPVNEDATKEVA
ncbi:MAG: 50S ribosomal protein L4 [Planctomycetota bacterium]|nr:50S ribosomal protein L4 [Planctomycetota bacterium]MDA1026700.1 50S ribosomal protein L4 [Planctomycetota bacterium]